MIVRTAVAVALGLAVATAVPAPSAHADDAPAPVAGTLAPVAATLPVAGTVGIPDGTALTPLPGGTIPAGGTTIANAVIDGDALFTGSNLTLRNVRVTGHAVIRGDNVVIERSQVGALSLSGTWGVRVSGVDVAGAVGQDGIHITSTSGTGQAGAITITDTWVHNPLVTPTSHYDGIQVRGVDSLTLQRVAVDLGTYQPRYNAALFLEDVDGGNRNVTVADSRFTGGGYEVYSFGVNIAYRGSVFGGGRWGHLYPSSPTFAITDFTGNADTAGSPLTLAAGQFVVGTPPAGPPTSNPPAWFSDVPLTGQFAPDIAWLRSSGITQGFPDGTFRPAASVTREAMAAFLYRAAGSPPCTPPATSPFVDVATSHPFYREIAWLAASGISTGTVTSQGAFYKPGDPVARDAMAAFLYRAAGSPWIAVPAVSPFADVTTAHPFYAAIAWMRSAGISTGWPDGSYRPGISIARDAMAAFLHRS